MSGVGPPMKSASVDGSIPRALGDGRLGDEIDPKKSGFGPDSIV